MKRFTETLKWGDPWFRRLSPPTKLLWFWMLDNCDHAGVIEIDNDIATFQIGNQYPLDTLLKCIAEIGDRVKKLEGEKYLVCKFIQFQYGELSRDCKAHNPVFVSLEKHNLLKEYSKGIHTPQDKDKDKDKDKDRKKGVQGEGMKKPTLDEVKEYCRQSGYTESDGVWFWNKSEGNGWTNAGEPIKSWKHTMAAWKGGGFFPSQKPGVKPITGVVGSCY